MDVSTYLKRRQDSLSSQNSFRTLCVTCMQPTFGCYCTDIKRFDPKIKFVILIHPIEVRRRIATGRMSHLCLEKSELLMGQNYSANFRVNQILKNPDYQPLVLYPGRGSVNLSDSSDEVRTKVFSKNKIPLVFVIDGTWATAKKMIRESKNLAELPRVCFTPPGPSQFRVRKQPGINCYSTIEAIHQTIELLGEAAGFSINDRKHDHLLEVFNKMVERQLEFIVEAHKNPNANCYRRPRFLNSRG